MLDLRKAIEVKKAKKREVVIEDQVRACPGNRHAWFNSNVGLVRKPYDKKNSRIA